MIPEKAPLSLNKKYVIITDSVKFKCCLTLAILWNADELVDSIAPVSLSSSVDSSDQDGVRGIKVEPSECHLIAGYLSLLL